MKMAARRGRPDDARATTRPTARSGSGTSCWSPGRGLRRSGCGRWCAAAIDFVLGLQTAARRDHLAAPRRRHARRLRAADRQRQHVHQPALRDRARRVPRPSRSRTGSSPPTSSPTRWPGTLRRSPTRAGSRWTGTTRCSAAPVRGAGRVRPAGRGLGHLRRARPRGALRQRRALGHRAPRPPSWRSRWRRSATRPGRWTCSSDPAPARRSGAYWTGWQYVNQAALPGRAEQLHRGGGGPGRRRDVRRDRRRRVFRDFAADPAVAVPSSGDAGCGCEPAAVIRRPRRRGNYFARHGAG